MSDPDWLLWAREIQAIAQTGLAFSKDPYDQDRFAALRRLSVQIMAAHTSAGLTRIEGLFNGETGYATPKIGVRAAVFDKAERILMVREAADGHRWTLPGGWADVNQTPAQSVVREVFEESGYQVRAVKLAAVWDRARQAQPPMAFSVIRMFSSVRWKGAPRPPAWRPAKLPGLPRPMCRQTFRCSEPHPIRSRGCSRIGGRLRSQRSLIDTTLPTELDEKERIAVDRDPADLFDLQRFVEAQKPVYQSVLAELSAGQNAPTGCGSSSRRSAGLAAAA